MRNGNSKRDFTGRIYGGSSKQSASAMNWENPYIKKRKASKSQATRRKSIPQTETLDLAPPPPKYSGSNPAALWDMEE